MRKARRLAGLSVRDVLVTSAAGASPSKRALTSGRASPASLRPI